MLNIPYSSVYSTVSPANGLNGLFVSVLFAITQSESSKSAATSGNASVDFQDACLKSGRLIEGNVVDSIPERPTPSRLRESCTGAPFQVTDVTGCGANIVMGVVPFVSPTRWSVDESIVAFRTRYGPNTRTDGVSGVRSKVEFEFELMRGFQTVCAVALSTTMTAVDPDRTRDIPEGVPVMMTVPFVTLARIAEEPVTVGAAPELAARTASTP
jgi:hypothetical protein